MWYALLCLAVASGPWVAIGDDDHLESGPGVAAGDGLPARHPHIQEKSGLPEPCLNR